MDGKLTLFPLPLYLKNIHIKLKQHDKHQLIHMCCPRKHIYLHVF